MICSKFKNRGDCPGSFKQTPNDPTRGVVVGFDPCVNSMSMSEKRPIFNPCSWLIGPGFASTFARGAGFVKLFLVGRPTTRFFEPIGPASNWGCYRKNRKFVCWSLLAPLVHRNRDHAVFHLWQSACMPRPRTCTACARAWENLNPRKFCPDCGICSGFAVIG